MTAATAAAFHPPWVGAATFMLAGLGAEIIDLIAVIADRGYTASALRIQSS